MELREKEKNESCWFDALGYALCGSWNYGHVTRNTVTLFGLTGGVMRGEINNSEGGGRRND
jgi:hypothetical protein